MSKSKIDSDGFQIITRSSKNKVTKVPRKHIELCEREIEIDIEEAYKRIKSCIEDLQGSLYLTEVSKAVSNILQKRNVVEIVCFGLGHVGECKVSQYQLAFLLCLQEFLSTKSILVHDPVFYYSECRLLKDLKVRVIQENYEGNYIIPKEGFTLVYLPHCPKQLTNNFLWSNWGLNLENCILLCNSFTSLVDNQPSRILKQVVPYIEKLYPLCTEIILDNNFTYKDIFNDTSLHYFPKNKLSIVPPNFWLKQEKPKYENDEEFITTKMIERLII